MAKKPSLNKLLELAEKYAGCVNDIADACKVKRQTVWQWKKDHPEFNEAMSKGNDFMLDLAKQGLRYHLEKKSEKTILYTLDRLGRKEGFGMFLQVTDKSKLDDQLDGMTDDQIIEEMERSRKRIEKANGGT
jgi:hypothetical protein